jgi:hypothetical protein
MPENLFNRRPDIRAAVFSMRQQGLSQAKIAAAIEDRTGVTVRPQTIAHLMRQEWGPAPKRTRKGSSRGRLSAKAEADAEYDCCRIPVRFMRCHLRS